MGNHLCGPTKYYSKANIDTDRYDDTRGTNIRVVISKRANLNNPVFDVQAFLGTRNVGGEMRRTVCGEGTIAKSLNHDTAYMLVKKALLEANCPGYLANPLMDTAVQGSSDLSISSPLSSPVGTPMNSEEY